MQITNEKLIQFSHIIDNLLKREGGDVPLHYAFLKNKKAIEGEREILEEARKPLDEFVAYDQARLETCKDFSEKDESGNPKFYFDENRTQRFKIEEEKEEAFEKAIVDLKEENKEHIDAQEKRDEDFRGLLEKEVDVELTIIPISSVPKEFKMTGEEMELIWDLFSE